MLYFKIIGLNNIVLQYRSREDKRSLHNHIRYIWGIYKSKEGKIKKNKIELLNLLIRDGRFELCEREYDVNGHSIYVSISEGEIFWYLYEMIDYMYEERFLRLKSDQALNWANANFRMI